VDFFTLIQNKGLEQLVFCHDEAVGLKGIIAVHNTVLGPALAPVRMLAYETEHDAVSDAVYLARNMTYRTAIADCDLGGGSCVLWADPRTGKSEALFRAFGRFIERFGGRLFVTMGVGTGGPDMHNIMRETDKVLAQGTAFGGLADPVELTADGLMQGLKATARELSGSSASLSGLTCLVQGLGRVGSAVVERLTEAGATIIVTDLNYDRIKNVQDRHPEVTMVRPDEVYDVRCDVIVPCAPPNATDGAAVDRLRCKAVAGASCFCILDLELADRLHERKILYMPHFVMDSAEAILADYERKRVPSARLAEAIEGIYRRSRNIQEEARERKEAPLRTSLRKAQERLNSIGSIGRRNAW